MLRLFEQNRFNNNDEIQAQRMRLQQLIEKIAQSPERYAPQPVAAAAANAEEEEKKAEEPANSCDEAIRNVMINTCDE